MENASEVMPPQTPAVAIVALSWLEAAGIEPSHVSQVLVQLGNPGPDGIPDGIYVSLGNVPPPIAPSLDEASARQEAERMQGSSIPVTVRGRFHMSRSFLGSMIEVLQRAADQHDLTVREVEAAKAAGEQE